MLRMFRGIVRCVAVLPLLGLIGVPTASSARAGSLHTFDGRHDISEIDLTVVYFVPKDRRPVPDWRERVDYFVRRMEAFHRRELGGRSTIRLDVRPEPLRSPRTADAFRAGDQNRTFDETMNEVKAALSWPGPRKGYPVLLVLSDINWRELDDFRRERVVAGEARHEGHVAGDGRHFPGAESGGSRCAYVPDEGIGLGLVSADGWRVPYSGSECAVYHEGIGHAIGLPHPEPVDESVMGLAQYSSWLNGTFLNAAQKEALGVPRDGRKDDSGRDLLFTAFTAIPRPAVPKPGQDVDLALTWPADARVRRLHVRVQTELFGPWRDAGSLERAPAPGHIAIGSFETPTPVSYRVNAETEDGQKVELWGYFQVRADGRPPE